MLVDPRWDKSVEPDTNDEWREVLRRAANLIARKGWATGDWASRDSDGRISGYCTVSAIYATRASYDGQCVAEEKLRQFVNPAICLTRWNDQQTDKKVVIDALRQAAKG